MIQRLPAATQDNPDPRGDLDRMLEVASWTTPATKLLRVTRPAEVGAPQWWRGDEEATDTFLRGMGLKSLDQLAQRG